MSWRHRDFTWKAPRTSRLRENAKKLVSGFCIPEPLPPLPTGILKGDRCIHSLDFWFGAEWMRRVLISTKPFHLCFVPGWRNGCDQRSPSHQRFPWALQLKEQILKEQIHGQSRLFQDAVFVRVLLVAVRFLSADDGHDRCLQCLGRRHAEAAFVDDSCVCCGRNEHDFAAISPFLYERIGTLCRHPCWSLWLEQRITGWHSGRSEGYCKSLSAGHAPTDLLLLTQRTSRSGSRVISLVCPKGRPAFHSVRHL